MENFDFNWDSMKEQVGADPFAQQTKKFEEDKRFYKLPKDEQKNGAAVIRFLPDADRMTIQKVNKINSTIVKDGKKRFVNEWSPSTIDMPCPFQEKWAELYNAGDKEGAKAFSRGVRYIANIKVLNDPAKPENNGKIFLLDMSGSLVKKLQEALEPTDTQKALGVTPKQLFNPIKGNNFTLSVAQGANDIATYDGSFVDGNETAIYASIEEAVNDIKENTFSLREFIAPESFLSYDELKKKLDWVQGNTQPAVAEVAPATPAATVAPVGEAAPLITEPAPVAPVAPVTPAAPTVNTQQTAPDLDSLLNELKQ